MRPFVKKLFRKIVFRYGKFWKLYEKLFNPNSYERADFLRMHGKLNSIGESVSINRGTTFTDPAYVRIGNNVVLSDCALIGHDGVVAMLYRAYGARVDSVGKIDILDNVFIGHGAIVLPNVTIGPNAVVAAGSIVTKDVPPGSIVAGVPAKSIGTVEGLVSNLRAKTEMYPWSTLIKNRDGGFDSDIEPELLRQRVNYFYPKS
jgi:acetyltransferase-like isoleucine patch superfamily enzyme